MKNETWKFDGPHGVVGARDSKSFIISTVRNGQEQCVCHVIFNPKEGDDTEECRRDARLVASAPTMLAALSTLLNLHDGINNGGDGVTDADWNNARLAIEKATGRRMNS